MPTYGTYDEAFNLANPSLASELRRLIGDRENDIFPAETIIRFTAYKRFSYAVIKADNGNWYTTAVRGDIPKILTFGQLLGVLRSPDVKDVQIATSFQAVA